MSLTSELQFKNYYVEKLYISANVETGVIYNRSGRRMIALTNDFLIGLHRALENECGDKVAQVLHRCGKKWGVDFGKGLDAEWTQFYEQPAKEFPLAFFQGLLMQEFGHNGWGVLTLNYDLFDKGVLWLSLQGAIMSEIYTANTKYPADALTAGILAGLFTHFLSSEIECIQTQQGDTTGQPSLFVMSAPPRIESIRNKYGTKMNHQTVVQDLLASTC